MPLFSKRDFVVIAIVIILYVLFISVIPRNEKSEYVIVDIEGQEVYRYAIFHDGVYPVYRLGRSSAREIPLLLLHIADEGVYVTDSTCPDKICEKTGEIRRPGQVIVCVPNKVLVRIEGTSISNDRKSPDVYTK